jgi:hypothetical protein
MEGKMRKIGMLLFLFMFVFTIIACDCCDDEGSTGTTQNTSTVIRGMAVLTPIQNAEIKLFHYGDDGSEIEIAAANAPVVTSSSGAYEFKVNLEDVKNIDTPLFLKSMGGTMSGQPAPELEALIPDPDELVFADGEITLHLSAASSVAARMLGIEVSATGSAPAIIDAKVCIEKVEKALNVDLTRDPSDAIQAVAIENMNTCEDLNLISSPENISAVNDYIEYVAGQLKQSADTPDGALAQTLGSEKKPWIYRLQLFSYRKNVQASRFDEVRIYISMRGLLGELSRASHGNVELEVVHGEGILSDTNLKLNNGRAMVFLASDKPGEVVVLARYKRHTGKILTQSIVINFINEDGSMNTPPVADAGVEQIVPTGNEVTLDGSNSNDPDGDDLTFAWTIVDAPQGSSATLSDSAAVAPAFTADLEGAYTIQLVVNDGNMDSDPATVTITAETVNSAPTADAGSGQQVATGDMVSLDGGGSSDSDGDPLTYAWTIMETPQGSTAALSDASAVNPAFTADMEGTYVIQLVVNDGNMDSDPATVTITAETPNSAPTADAGNDQQAQTGTVVRLDGTGSSDPDGDSLTFSWYIASAPQGSNAFLSNPTGDTAFCIPDVPGAYAIQLTVNDGSLDSTPDTVILIVE